MNDDEVERLNRAFGFGDGLLFSRGPAGFIFANIQNRLCHALVCLHGGQVLSFMPAGGRELLWLSPKVDYRADKAIRGGIPVCFPWFGRLPPPPAGAAARPQHGYARLLDWSVCAVERGGSSPTRLSLLCPAAADGGCSEWQGLEARLEIELGAELKLSLSVKNRSDVPKQCSAALHSYFKISDIGAVRITSGECGCGAPPELSAGVSPQGDYDITFENSHGPYLIEDSAFDSFITVSKENSDETVIWNPGPAKAAALSDMGSAAVTSMVCVEAARVGAGMLRLAPGAEECFCLRAGLSPAGSGHSAGR